MFTFIIFLPKPAVFEVAIVMNGTNDSFRLYIHVIVRLIRYVFNYVCEAVITKIISINLKIVCRNTVLCYFSV